MARKLVLVIDRDDDLGQKTGISSPVVGRENVLSAAVRLGIADPEDSDVNAMLAGIKVYDELKKSGEDVEVAVICGDKSVGVASDSKIAEQIDRIVLSLKPTNAVVVTDGSEDEFVLPIISSRLKIDSISRVVVRQSRTIESTYFLLKRMFNEPKVARITLAPLGMVFLVYSTFLMLQHPEWGLGGIIFFLGVYFLVKAYGWDRNISSFLGNVKLSLVEGRLSFIFYVISAILLIIGIINGLNAAINAEIAVAFASFIFHSTWWLTLSGIFLLFARASDAYAENRRVTKYFMIMFLVIALGMILWASSGYVMQIISLREFAGAFLAAIFISLIGAFTLKRF